MAPQGRCRRRITSGLAPIEQRARVSLARSRLRALATGTRAAAEKEALLGGLMDFLLPQKYFVVPDTGWSKWDLKIARGLWSRALVTVCAENHGGAKRLLRVRCAMRLLAARPRAAAQLRGADGGGADPRRAVSWRRSSLPLGLVNLGVIGWQLVDVRPADAPHRRGGGAAGQADAGRADRPARAADRRAAHDVAAASRVPEAHDRQISALSAGRIAGGSLWALAQVFLIAGFELLKPWPLQIVIDDVLGGKTPPAGGPVGELLACRPDPAAARLHRHRRSCISAAAR